MSLLHNDCDGLACAACGAAADEAGRLTPAQRRQLLGKAPRNRSEAGGRMSTYDALVRKGIYVHRDQDYQLTEFGELVAQALKESAP